MIKKRALAASREPEYKIREDAEPSNFVFHAGNMLDENSEVLKVGPDGFWVRGVKVPQDDKEAELVYNAFKEWLIYHQLTRSYK